MNAEPWKVVGQPQRQMSQRRNGVIIREVWSCLVQITPELMLGVPGGNEAECWANAHAVAACHEMHAVLSALASLDMELAGCRRRGEPAPADWLERRQKVILDGGRALDKAAGESRQ